MSSGPRFRRDPGREATLVQDVPEQPVVEEEIGGPPPPPGPRRRPPTLWPWLLLLLLLVAAGLIALWLFTRDNGHEHTRSVTVPNVIGQKQGPAVRRLDGAGLTSRLVAKPSSEPAGMVFAQHPGPGTPRPGAGSADRKRGVDQGSGQRARAEPGRRIAGGEGLDGHDPRLAGPD